MARYKPYDYTQTRLIPVSLEHQLLQGTLEHAIHVLVDHRMDLSLFDGHYQNDETGCRAYDPKILLKVVLFAYSRGFVGSRRIEWLCAHHVTCMALACLQCPDHSTIAAFVSSMHAEILALFCEILLVCEEQRLLGGTVFALDGLKLSFNASQEWSGTLQELQHKQAKLEAKIAQLLAEHQQVDRQERPSDGQDEGIKDVEGPDTDIHDQEVQEVALHEGGSPADDPAEEAWQPEASSEVAHPEVAFQDAEMPDPMANPRSLSPTKSGGPKRSPPQAKRSRQQRQQPKRERRLKRLRHHAERLNRWLATHEPRRGRQGKEIQSTLTDPESAKMPTSHGVV
jgi:transposase